MTKESCPSLLRGSPRLKEARSPVDMLVVTAYYLEKYLRRDQYTPGDLQAQRGDLPTCRRRRGRR